jgi:Integrase zinc binding domain
MCQNFDRKDVISEFHDPPHRGHFGIAKTLKAVTSKFSWPKMDLDIRKDTSTHVSFVNKANQLTNTLLDFCNL